MQLISHIIVLVKDFSLVLARARLYELELEKQQQEQYAARKVQVGTGSRSEKIRTYNWLKTMENFILIYLFILTFKIGRTVDVRTIG